MSAGPYRTPATLASMMGLDKSLAPIEIPVGPTQLPDRGEIRHSVYLQHAFKFRDLVIDREIAPYVEITEVKAHRWSLLINPTPIHGVRFVEDNSCLLPAEALQPGMMIEITARRTPVRLVFRLREFAVLIYDLPLIEVPPPLRCLHPKLGKGIGEVEVLWDGEWAIPEWVEARVSDVYRTHRDTEVRIIDDVTALLRCIGAKIDRDEGLRQVDIPEGFDVKLASGEVMSKLAKLRSLVHSPSPLHACVDEQFFPNLPFRAVLRGTTIQE